MFDARKSDEVITELGSKVVDAFAECVDRARLDYETWRAEHPDWLSEATARGTANWVHDRMFAHLIRLLDGVPDVNIVDAPPTREVAVGLNFLVRLKRHHADGTTRSYPTQTALDFLDQPMAFEGMELVHLHAGYLWDEDAHDIGPAVLSLHDRGDVVWMVELPTTPGAASAPVAPLPTTDDPTPAGIEIRLETSEAMGDTQA